MKNLGILSVFKSLIMTETHDIALLIFEFEEVFVIAVGFMLVLMYLFYVKYPYNQDID